MRNIIKGIAFLAVLTLFFAFMKSAPSFASDATSKDIVTLEPIRISLSAQPRSIQDIGTLYADKFDIFKKHNISIVRNDISGSRNRIAGLIAGELDMIYTSGSIMTAIAEGADLVIVGVEMNRLPFYFVTRPEIASLADLTGKKIVLPGETQTRLFFSKQMRLDQIKDVSILTIENTIDRITALDSGVVAGVMLSPPSVILAKERGYRILLDFSQKETAPPHIVYYIVTTRAFLSERPDLVMAYLKAITESTYQMKKDRDGTISVIAENFSLDAVKDRKALEETYDILMRNLPVVPEIDSDTIRLILASLAEENPKVKSLAIKDVCDDSAFKALESDGFFDRFRE